MRIRQILDSIWKEFIYGGHFQSLGAASIVFVSAILLKIQVTWDILLVTYLIFYPAYLYNRFKEIDIDYLTNTQRTEYLKTYINRAPIILSLVIFIPIVSLIYFSNLQALIFGLLLLSFGFLYTVIFKKFTRRIVFFKNFYVAVFFASLVFFPIVYYSYPLTNSLLISVLIFTSFVFLKTFMMQIFLDVKDIETDKKEGLLTFPVIFGKDKTLNILKIISILTTVPILLIFSLYWNVFPKLVLVLFLTIPFNLYCFNQARDQKYSGYILASGEFVLWLILIIISETII